jgi:hypothetical protein
VEIFLDLGNIMTPRKEIKFEISRNMLRKEKSSSGKIDPLILLI